MKIAIVAAMQEELAPFRQNHTTEIVYQHGKTVIEKVSDQLYLVESGIGKANAAATAAYLTQQVAIDLIINTGSTGSFRSEIALGDVVVSDRFIYSDVDATGFGYARGQVPQMPADYPVPAELLARVSSFLQAAAATYTVHVGTIVTSDSFMSDVAAIKEITTHFPDIYASDMESAAIAQIASFASVPVLNIRGISDHVGSDAPETFNETLALAASNAADAVNQLVAHLLQ